MKGIAVFAAVLLGMVCAATSPALAAGGSEEVKGIAAPMSGAQEPATGAAPAAGGAQTGASGVPARAGVQAAETAASEGPDRAVEYPEGLVHTVVEGDTLWDLSAKYLGSPWKWPVLWERNRFLTNPHFIYPGIRIEIFPPPAREYAGVTPPPAEAAPAVPPAVEAKPLPPPPPSGPALPLLDIKPADLVSAGEFVAERPSGVGSIAGAAQDRIAFSTGEKVFLSLSRDLPAGQLLGVYRVRGPVKAPGDRTISGYVRYLVGVLQLLPKEQGRPAARIRAAFEELLRTDVLSEEIPAYSPVPLRAGPPGVEASVIAGRRENVELAQGDFIYLSRGAAAGVERGSTFTVFEKVNLDKDGGEAAQAGPLRVPVAKAVVVAVSPRFATAYVCSSLCSFAAGAFARGAGVEGAAAK